MRLLVLLTLLVAANVARADSLTDVFARGTAAYTRGDYAAAIDEYQTLLDARVADASVTYNLGLAHARLGHYGQAIRFLERTLVLSPGDEAAERDLKVVREALGERQARERGEAIVAERPPLSTALFASFRTNTLAWLLFASTWLLCGAVAALLFVKGEAQRLSLGIGTTLLFALVCISAFGLGAKYEFGAEGVRGVVLADGVALREGPDEAARMASELNEGEAVRIIGQDSRFAHVVLSRGISGFVLRSAVGEI